MFGSVLNEVGLVEAEGAEQPYPWNPSCLESILPLKSWNGLEGTFKDPAVSRDLHLQPDPIQTRFLS